MTKRDRYLTSMDEQDAFNPMEGFIPAFCALAAFFILAMPMLVALIAVMFWPVYKLIEFLY